MKNPFKGLKALKGLSAFFLPLSVYAFESSSSTPNLAFGFHPYGGVGAGIEYYKYDEPHVMSISGPMYRLSGVFGAKLNPLLKADVQIYYSQDIGQNIYEGGLQDSKTKTTTPFSAKSGDYYVGTSARVGFIIGDGIDQEWAVLYTGLGYRYLNNDIQNPPGQIVSYRREQSYLYMPFGIDVKVWLNSQIRLKLNGELRALLVGKNTSHFTDVGYDNDLHFTQKSGSGSRVSLGAEIFITKRQAITLEAYFEYWGIKDSDTKAASRNGKITDYFLEPKNNTKVFGVQVGYAF